MTNLYILQPDVLAAISLTAFCYLASMEKDTEHLATPGQERFWQRISVSLALKLVIAVGGMLLLLDHNFQAGAATLGILVITFLPLFMRNLLHFRIPAELETLSILFIYLSLFLGEVKGFYARYWWWDILLHTTSGLLGGMIGFLLVYVLNNNKKINLNLTPQFIALFAFMFAMSMGALWEIFEFAMDNLFGLTMQGAGLEDTMSDLIDDCGGALAVSLLGYFYLSNKGKDHLLKRVIHKFVLANPRIFRNQKNRQF